jgi:hypothetical protein
MITRNLRWTILALTVSFAWAGCQPAAQTPGEHQQHRPSVQEKGRSKVVKLDDDSLRVRFLVLETVQKDLGLTDGQITEIKRCRETGSEQFREFRTKVRVLFPPGQHLTKEEAERHDRESRILTDEMKSKQKALQTKVLAMLTPSQSDRLKQIQLQASIPIALTKPEIIKVLGTSEEQNAKIRALCDRTEEKERAAIPDLHGLDIKQQRQKMLEYVKASHKIWAEAEKPILDVLTPSQRAKFEKLQGRKVDLTWPDDLLVPEDTEF